MHQIGVVGLSYRHVGVEEVARFALPRAEIPARLPALRTLLKSAEILYVGTCNRVEVLYATDEGSAAHHRFRCAPQCRSRHRAARRPRSSRNERSHRSRAGPAPRTAGAARAGAPRDRRAPDAPALRARDARDRPAPGGPARRLRADRSRGGGACAAPGVAYTG